MPLRKAEFSRLLLAWYRRNRRDLPWRGTRDPYRIVVSEFMLQQTQVDTVLPYYRRFLEAFPDVQALARASLGEVLKAWEGLGYYARARNLHLCAREIASRWAGQVSDRQEDLAELPGFGPYTTRAVLSIAFGSDVAAVDGNVVRVLCRYFGIQEEAGRPGTRLQIDSLAQELVPPGQAGDYNQALMELGALVCRPRRPACEECPVADNCAGRAEGNPERLPVKARKAARPNHEDAVGFVVSGRGGILISRRPEKGLLGGLWELPGARRPQGETLAACCARGILEKSGVTVQVRGRVRRLKQAFTHFDLTLHAFRCDYRSGRPGVGVDTDAHWVDRGDLQRYAFSSAHRRLLEGWLDQASSAGLFP